MVLLTEIVEFSGVEKFLDTPVKHFSSGMYVRLGFSIAAYLEPEILLVDEVLAVGDARFQKKCLSKMNEVAKSGRTILFVSHNMEVIASLCSSCLLLENNRAHFFDSTDDAIHAYHDFGGGTGEIDYTLQGRQPGDGVVSLLRVRTRNDLGECASSFDITSPMTVEVEYEVHEDGVPAMAHFFVRDGMQRLVFPVEIIPFIKDDIEDFSLGKGIYRFTCSIPANFMNTGTYSIDIMIRSYNQLPNIHLQENGSLCFTVTEQMQENPFRVDFYGPMEGAVRPLLQCKNEKL